jgi:hypothetical protein
MRGGHSSNELLIDDNKIPRGYDRILCIYYTSNTHTNPTITSHYIQENEDKSNPKYEIKDEENENNVKRVTLRENGENFKIVDSLIKFINPESSKGNEGSERGEQGKAEEEG